MRGTTGSPYSTDRLSLQREVRVQRLRVERKNTMNERAKPQDENDEPVLGMNKVIRYTSENTGHFGGWGPKIRL